MPVLCKCEKWVFCYEQAAAAQVIELDNDALGSDGLLLQARRNLTQLEEKASIRIALLCMTPDNPCYFTTKSMVQTPNHLYVIQVHVLLCQPSQEYGVFAVTVANRLFEKSRNVK